MVLPSPVVPVDSRANKLLKFRVVRDRAGSNFYVYIRCADSVAQHVEGLLHVQNCRWHPLPQNGGWTHCLRFDGPYYSGLRDTLQLLTEVLHIPSCEAMDVVLALDFYKTPPQTEDQGWGWTDVGSLIYRAKYWTDDMNEPQRSGAKLANLLAKAVKSHKLMRCSDGIIAIPGTQPQSFGEQLAEAVASRCKLQLISAKLPLGSNPSPAKEGHQPNEQRTYFIDQDVEGDHLLVIDDVYRSGKTMSSVGQAARAAGASRVYGLVGARTHRR